jgi:hypothetical protein
VGYSDRATSRRPHASPVTSLGLGDRSATRAHGAGTRRADAADKQTLARRAIAGTCSLDELEHGIFLHSLSAPNSTDSALKSPIEARRRRRHGHRCSQDHCSPATDTRSSRIEDIVTP